MRPSADSALPVPMIDRSDVVPVLSCSAPLATIDEAVVPVVVVSDGGAVRIDRGLDAGGEIDRIQHVGDGAALQVDGRVAVAVGDEVAVDNA